MTTRELLIAARKRIEQPERWTQGARARNHRDETVSALVPSARRWCSIGAIDAVCEPASLPTIRRAIHIMASVAGSRVCDFNDEHSHGDVLRLFDRAIEACDA